MNVNSYVGEIFPGDLIRLKPEWDVQICPLLFYPVVSVFILHSSTSILGAFPSHMFYSPYAMGIPNDVRKQANHFLKNNPDTSFAIVDPHYVAGVKGYRSVLVK